MDATGSIPPLGTPSVPSVQPVPPGPFESEPVELGRVLTERFSPAVTGDEVVRRCERWLIEVLADAGVELGAFDREVAHLLAVDGWSVAQVVAGWVRRTPDRGPARDRVPARS